MPAALVPLIPVFSAQQLPGIITANKGTHSRETEEAVKEENLQECAAK
jgi:hypothetical protein